MRDQPAVWPHRRRPDFQAKGHRYSTQVLVGGDADLAEKFADGAFAGLPEPEGLPPHSHACDGTLRQMIYVPGDLFSVNPATARSVPGLFARNERVVCVFDGADWARLCWCL